MNMRNLTPLLALIILATSVGCISKSAFRENNEKSAAGMVSVEGAVEANERRIADLGRETDSRLGELSEQTQQASNLGRDAMSRADEAALAAERAANGKLVWSVTISDDSVKFPFNGVQLPDEANQALDDVVNNIKTFDKAVYIEIEGHTDNMGGDDYNHSLGLKRADAVRDYLSRSGIPLHAMNTISHGESTPIADNSTLDGRKQNRRVVIRVLE
jgi:peptidoglycan-associated lipoprotein